MSALKAGDSFPEGVTFTYIPYSDEKKDLTACGIPVKYDASKGNSSATLPATNPPTAKERKLTKTTEFKDKKIVIVAVPGAFTPTCQEQHIVSYTRNVDALRAKGVDNVVIIASNDAYVMSAWGKANGITGDFFVSDFPSRQQLRCYTGSPRFKFYYSFTTALSDMSGNRSSPRTLASSSASLSAGPMVTGR